MTMNDPRLGLPSASSFALDALCPGRQQLLRELGDMPEPIDEDADRGTKLHKAWQLEDPTGLDSEDVEIYERGLKLKKEVSEQWALEFGFRGIQEGQREERFYWHNENGELSASGQADCHWMHWKQESGHSLICDYKSLWNRNVTPAELNYQARLLSVLVAREYGATHVRFAFLKAMFGKADIVDYTSEDLERAQYSIQQVLWESDQKDAQRRPGAHCRHCKAAAGCPEVAAWQMLPSVQAKAQNGHVTPKVATELVSNISLLDCRNIWESSTARHNIEDACKARLKALPEPTLVELGLTFGKPKILRPITNVQSAFEFLLSLGVPAAKLWSVTKMSNGELATVVQEALGLPSKDAAEKWIRDKLSYFITEKETDRPIEKIK